MTQPMTVTQALEQYAAAMYAEWACDVAHMKAQERHAHERALAWPPERVAERRALNARIEAEAAERARRGTSYTAENIQRRAEALAKRKAADRAALTDGERAATASSAAAQVACGLARTHSKAAYWALRAVWFAQEEGVPSDDNEL